jgi:hypothetical protein
VSSNETLAKGLAKCLHEPVCHVLILDNPKPDDSDMLHRDTVKKLHDCQGGLSVSLLY